LLKPWTKTSNSQSGVALLVALMALLIISAAAAAMIMMSNSETYTSSNFKDEQVAFFASKAGLEEIRDRMMTTASNSLSTVLPTNLPGTTNGVLYVTNDPTAQPWNTTGSKYPDDEICKEVACSSNVPAGAPWYTTNAASATYAATPKLPWKWVRITLKTNKSSGGTVHTNSVDGATNGNLVCWNGTNETVTATADCGAQTPVYVATALATTASGSRRMTQFEERLNLKVPVVAALYSKLGTNVGDALNVTGATDPVCNMPSTYGAASGTSTVTTPGGGNVTGSPQGTINNYGWSQGNMSGLVNPLLLNSTSITTVPGVTGPTGNPPTYTLPHGSLGTPPTVTYNGGQAITAITSPGVSAIYNTPVLAGTGSPAPVGTFTIGGGAGGVSGSGVLIVQGNLTIDVGTGFNYFGLILATGNITMISSTNASVTPNIHGAIIAGGSFSAPISNFGGSISIHQNACMVQSALGPQFYRTVAVRELMY
jgi:Tfp pilus assembly protein PilV